jgi:hypothetical protein
VSGRGVCGKLMPTMVGRNLPLGKVLEMPLPLETQLGRRIHPACFTPAEFKRRRAEPD